MLAYRCTTISLDTTFCAQHRSGANWQTLKQVFCGSTAISSPCLWELSPSTCCSHQGMLPWILLQHKEMQRSWCSCTLRQNLYVIIKKESKTTTIQGKKWMQEVIRHNATLISPGRAPFQCIITVLVSKLILKQASSVVSAQHCNVPSSYARYFSTNFVQHLQLNWTLSWKY